MSHRDEVLQYTNPRDRDEDGYPDSLECDCSFSGDEADASGCELHGYSSRRELATEDLLGKLEALLIARKQLKEAA